MKYERRGNVVANVSDFAKLGDEAVRIKDWRDRSSPKTQRKIRDRIKDAGLLCETVFDAAHGRRYLLFVYAPFPASRKKCWDVLTGG